MAKGIRYSDEFKQEAVNQITKHSYDVAEVSTRLGVSAKSYINGSKRFPNPLKSAKPNQIYRQKLLD